MCAELAADRLHVVADRLGRDAEHERNPVVGRPGGDQVQDLLLSRRQPDIGLRLDGIGPLHDALNAGQEFRRVKGPGYKILGVARDRRRPYLGIVYGADKDDGQRPPLPDLLGQPKPVRAWRADVQDGKAGQPPLSFQGTQSAQRLAATQSYHNKVGTQDLLYQVGNVRLVARDEAGVALLTNATPMSHLRTVSEAGGLMPQKSTYFYPKPLTRLVINVME